ncbi:MAG: hypothetical protein Q9213_006372 [Squamulea squamosa]
MVNTRGQRPSTAQIDPALAQGSLTAELIAAAATPLPIDTGVGENHVATHTRSRKRRRSDSPVVDELDRNAKRSNTRRVASPVAKRTAATANANPQVALRRSPPQGTRPTEQDASTTALGGDGSSDHGAYDRQHDSEDLESPQTADGDLVPEQSPDMHAVMSRIIDHGENVDNQYGQRGHNLNGLAQVEGIVPQGASLQLKIQSLPILDNLARQILTTFAKSSYAEILSITTDNDSEPSTAYSTLKSLFDHTKKVYSITSPFLSPPSLGLVEREQVETIRKANLATFVSSVFGSQDVGFYDLDEFFLDTFLADGGRLLKNQAGLFLDLKTQAYISAIAHRDRSREDILQDLFPDDIEQRLLRRRSGAKQLAPGEVDFIQRANNRKKTLFEESVDNEAIAQLPQKYAWDEFLRDVSGYVSKNSTSITGLSANGRKTLNQTRTTNYFETEQSPQPKRHVTRKPPPEQVPQESDTAPVTAPTTTFARVAQMVPPATNDITQKAARAAQFALEDFGVNNGSAGISQDGRQEEQQQEQPQQYPTFQFEQQPAPYYTHQDQFHNESEQQVQQLQSEQRERGDLRSGRGVFIHGHVPYPTQTAPTSVLYELARQAATAKASPSNRRAGHPSQRRPWSQEEENSLMSGLDHVKGPHWSQILALYGPGGTLNETLKDRNQVQLKDKARNLKLFFLKSGIEVPYYLQFVTGELKTRAPQAAKQEQQRNENAARLEEEAGNGNGTADDSAQLDDPEQPDNDTNMEDGEGEVIDPAEYAAVHGAGSQLAAAIQTTHDLS